MSHYTTQIFLFKGSDESCEKVRSVVNIFMEHNPYDEVGIQYYPAVKDEYSIVECCGRNTTFGNVFDALRNCGLSELHYVDYTDGAPFGSSDLGRFLIVKESEGEQPTEIALCADSEETLIERFKSYLGNKPGIRYVLDNGHGDIFELMDAVNEITGYYPHYRYLECEQGGVCHFEDVDFFP